MEVVILQLVKEHINVKKGKNIWKFENLLKKCRWLHAIIARNKLLEETLEQVDRYLCFSNLYGIMKPGLI